MILAVAGRRPDLPGADPPRFPAANVPLVRRRLRRVLRSHAPRALVTSASCGTDLIALEEAIAVSIPCHVVLPFSPDHFRRSSVVDRGAEWGPIYDRVLKRVELIIQPPALESTAGDPYVAACGAIVDEAARLGRDDRLPVAGVVVWDGGDRGPGDITQEFLRQVLARGWKLFKVSTLARR